MENLVETLYLNIRHIRNSKAVDLNFASYKMWWCASKVHIHIKKDALTVLIQFPVFFSFNTLWPVQLGWMDCIDRHIIIMMAPATCRTANNNLAYYIDISCPKCHIHLNNYQLKQRAFLLVHEFLCRYFSCYFDFVMAWLFFVF